MTEDTEIPKTALELQVEALQNELKAMKSDYETQIKEYKDANKGLWAELHKVPEDDPEPVAVPEKKGFDMDKAVETFNACYGIKNTKE